MGYIKTSSEVYARAWEGYQIRCREEGFVALNQYCLSIGMKAKGLYEWLRRRKISLSDFHDKLSAGSGVTERSSGEVSFCEVKLPTPPPVVMDAVLPHTVEARFDLRSGDKVSLSGVSIADVAYLMETLNGGCNVGS